MVGIVGLHVPQVLAQLQLQPQIQHETTAPFHTAYASFSDQDVRQRVLTDAWHAAEAAKSHVEDLTRRIQQLKRHPLSDPIQIKELEQERIVLLRQHMVAQQFQTIPDRIKTDF